MYITNICLAYLIYMYRHASGKEAKMPGSRLIRSFYRGSIDLTCTLRNRFAANLKKWIEASQIIHGQFYAFRMYDSVASDDGTKEIHRIRQEVYEQEITVVSAVGVHLDRGNRAGVGRRRLARLWREQRRIECEREQGGADWTRWILKLRGDGLRGRVDEEADRARLCRGTARRLVPTAQHGA